MGRGSAALSAEIRELGLDREAARYAAYHAPRYAILIEGLRARIGSGPDASRPRVLDIGPAVQTVLIRRAVPHATVDTLGYASAVAPPREGERHIDFDLTAAGDAERRPTLEPYDAIVLAEVIEHLATSPRSELECVASWLRPGGLLVLQTPNALALHKRLRALVGRDPLGAGGSVAAPSHSQVHFREYTLAELRELAAATGFDEDEAVLANHFRHQRAAQRLYDRATAALPAGTRQGITLYLRRR